MRPIDQVSDLLRDAFELVAGSLLRRDPRIPEPAGEPAFDEPARDRGEIARVDRESEPLQHPRPQAARRNRVVAGIEGAQQAEMLERALPAPDVARERKHREGFPETNDLDHHRQAVRRHDEMVRQTEQGVVRVLRRRALASKTCRRTVAGHSRSSIATTAAGVLRLVVTQSEPPFAATSCKACASSPRAASRSKRRPPGRTADHQRRDRPGELGKARRPDRRRRRDPVGVDVHQGDLGAARCWARVSRRSGTPRPSGRTGAAGGGACRPSRCAPAAPGPA